jgi:hypothetical protein
MTIKLTLFHSNSQIAKDVIEVFNANIASFVRESSLLVLDINDNMPGSVTKVEKQIKLVTADLIIILVDIDLINDNEFFDYWQQFLFELRNPTLAIPIQSFYGFKDLPIYKNQSPTIYGSDLLSTNSDFTRLIEIVKSQLT